MATTTTTSNQSPVIVQARGPEALFDDIGPAYEPAFEGLPGQLASIKWVLSQLEEGNIKPGKVMDLGCGTGRPVCSQFADAGHDALGVEISTAMVKAARERVPNAKFEQMDHRQYSAPPATFDAITVFFSMLTGMSQEDIRQMIRKIYDWLKPGGVFVFATVPISSEHYYKLWLGRPDVGSSLGREESLDWIRNVGFEVVHEYVEKFTPKAVEEGICGPEEKLEETHLFVYARKPAQ
ncbi:hypothetical protein MMC16_005336 [Acarospora aff. strigata]|nr:hypothetical protein [Acarospora aff. strigata]